MHFDFNDANEGNGTFYILIDGEVQPFIGCSRLMGLSTQTRGFLVCVVRRDVDFGVIQYGVSINGAPPKEDDWFFGWVEIRRLRRRKGVIFDVLNDKGKIRFVLAWPKAS